MAKFLEPNTLVEKTHDVKEITLLCKIVSQFVEVLIVTMGDKGVITVTKNINNKNETHNKILEVRSYTVHKLNNVDNVSGAGDCFASGFVHGVLLGYSEPYCVSLGFEAAKSALLCESTVPPEFQIPSNMIDRL
ncbi:unnamed protein product [Parnassius apollo]|uniref:(apollo) hypothetical protein n=1 Tax=Parnassius apollo TaxID=110799 RepID=A0A8S3XCX6_PARAO|nr:unnamed protein product [Parnassius apollo]